MDSLPVEILIKILTHVPKRSLPTTRLVCRTFDVIIFLLFFYHIPQWLDYDLSHRAVLSLAHDVYNRPGVMWSPWATAPDGPVQDSWLRIVWRLLVKSPLPGLLANGEGEGDGKGGDDGEVLTADNFARLSGREELSENRLRMGQNRFLMHREYSEECWLQSYYWTGTF